jgi:hypothetical protein
MLIIKLSGSLGNHTGTGRRLSPGGPSHCSHYSARPLLKIRIAGSSILSLATT